MRYTPLLPGLFLLCGSLSIGPAATAQPDDAYNISNDLPILVITPMRTPMALARSGSAIQVIGREEIEAWGARSVADVLRGQAGLDITENGGPGSLSFLSLRGANASQTLVLIDGMRVGDAASIGGEFDFSVLSTQDVERIEILRGPQSALYGSDAMGGVVNIITRQGARAPRTVLNLEAGSYGTVSSSLATSGASEKLAYAFSIHGLHTDGFSRYGYRIGRITSQLARKLERDSTDKLGGSARVTYRPTQDLSIDLGFRRYSSWFQFDNPGAFALANKDTAFNKGRQHVTAAFARINGIVLDGRLENALTLFVNETKRFNRLEQSCFDAAFMSYDCNTYFTSRRYGVEYQGNLDMNAFGKLVFGARHEVENASSSEQWLTPGSPRQLNFSGRQTTNSVFAIYQKSFERLAISFSSRYDSVDSKIDFLTWRATAAYSIPETGTKFRASAGTGAKAPTLFQRFSIYGTPNLEPERNFGYDIGVDQSLWDGRIIIGATWFEAFYRNLIDFDFTLNNGVGGYFNVGRASTKGVELTADIDLVPRVWRIGGAYTYMVARNKDTGLALLRRPRHKGSLSVSYSGIRNLTIQAKATFVGARKDIANDFPFARTRMAPFGKLDARAAYRVNDRLTLTARAENITNARYQEIRDFGVAGRSFYAGATVTW